MAACGEEWCSATFGRWYFHPLNRRRVLKSDARLGLCRFSVGLQRRFPDALTLAAQRYYPDRMFWRLNRAVVVRGVLDEQFGLSPHLHFPIACHLKDNGRGDHYDEPWDEERYKRDLAERAHLRPDQPLRDHGPAVGLEW